jgi:hypothetical protein
MRMIAVCKWMTLVTIGSDVDMLRSILGLIGGK